MNYFLWYYGEILKTLFFHEKYQENKLKIQYFLENLDLNLYHRFLFVLSFFFGGGGGRGCSVEHDSKDISKKLSFD